MMRQLAIICAFLVGLVALSGCGVKGDPLPVEAEVETEQDEDA